jgi:phosphoribosyl-dephospho-CoA transferase
MSSPCTRVERPAGRHDLVFVTPDGWDAMLSGRGDLAADPLVAMWSSQGWPTIRRRAMPDEPRGVALGLPLPPSAGKKRLSFLLEDKDVAAVTRPPSLDAAREAAAPAWRPTLDCLGELAARHSVEARVFGSLAWQALTGLCYVTDNSDLDLLLEVHPDADLDRLTAEIAAIDAGAPMRLDGELMRGDGSAVNWRELHAGADQVLEKSIEGVSLIAREHFVLRKMVS